MGGSLFDQLKKSGVVDERRAKKAKQAKVQQVKQAKHAKQQAGKNAVLVDENSARIDQLKTDKTERDRELNLQRKLLAERKAIAAQIKQLIQMNRVDDGKGEVGFNFTDNNNVQRIYVSASQQEQLSRGNLAIVSSGGAYCLVPAGVAKKIAERDPDIVILSEPAAQDSPNADDPYAEFEIPDDLMW